MGDWDIQCGTAVRFEWGPAGARRLATEAACLVAVDVLSFTTAVSVAVEKGIRVLPFWWPDGPATEVERTGAAQAAAAYARQSGARPAAHRHTVTPETPRSLPPPICAPPPSWPALCCRRRTARPSRPPHHAACG
ncbi:hypothetical protein AB0I54_12980 [Streptomyces sp. NPDC050625]|uniref:hypothetical protein n=1 Tax=Streptomyces sp. NPDC050625 TaxID=3154629 RepID=UPI003447E357